MAACGNRQEQKECQQERNRNFFHRFGYFCLAVRVSWPVSPECFVPDVFRSMHMVGIQKPGQTPAASGICRKTIVSKFFLPAMSVGVLHVRCGRGITRCLSDIVGRRVAQPAGISLGKVKNAPRNAGDLSGFPGDSWRASFGLCGRSRFSEPFHRVRKTSCTARGTGAGPDRSDGT